MFFFCAGTMVDGLGLCSGHGMPGGAVHAMNMAEVTDGGTRAAGSHCLWWDADLVG